MGCRHEGDDIVGAEDSKSERDLDGKEQCRGAFRVMLKRQLINRHRILDSHINAMLKSSLLVDVLNSTALEGDRCQAEASKRNMLREGNAIIRLR